MQIVISFTPLWRHPPGKEPLVYIGQEAGWAPELLWGRGLEKKVYRWPESNSDAPGRRVRNAVTTLTELPRAVTQVTKLVKKLTNNLQKLSSGMVGYILGTNVSKELLSCVFRL
jgi:hypothetical protein